MFTTGKLAAITWAGSGLKTQNLKCWFENICLPKGFVTAFMTENFRENQTYCFQNNTLIFVHECFWQSMQEVSILLTNETLNLLGASPNKEIECKCWITILKIAYSLLSRRALKRSSDKLPFQINLIQQSIKINLGKFKYRFWKKLYINLMELSFLSFQYPEWESEWMRWWSLKI